MKNHFKKATTNHPPLTIDTPPASLHHIGTGLTALTASFQRRGFL